MPPKAGTFNVACAPLICSVAAEKVLKRLDFEVKKSDVEAIVNCKPGVIELVLMQLQQKVRSSLWLLNLHRRRRGALAVE